MSLTSQTVDEMTVMFNLLVALGFTDIVAALGTDLRIGVHAIAFDDDCSESFVSTVVPVPAVVWLFGSGLLGLVGIARCRSMRNIHKQKRLLKGAVFVCVSTLLYITNRAAMTGEK